MTPLAVFAAITAALVALEWWTRPVNHGIREARRMDRERRRHARKWHTRPPH